MLMVSASGTAVELARRLPAGERQRSITLRFLAEPTDVNFGGKVHGGAVMKWIDQAGYTCAAGWSGAYCVTVYLGGLHFLGPIRVGELVELRALVIRTGRTSLDIAIDVYAGDPKSPERRRTGHCVVVFVALTPTASRPRCPGGPRRRRWTGPSKATPSGWPPCASRWTPRWRSGSAVWWPHRSRLILVPDPRYWGGMDQTISLPTVNGSLVTGLPEPRTGRP